MFTLGDSAILALALGSPSDAPTFFQVFTDSREMQVLGDQPALYKALHLSPDGSQAVIEFEDNSGQNGWDLVLVGPDGKLQRELMIRPEHDMMPAWCPDGGELAFLAERSAPQ
jgi:Tol biopolymer transport system component